MWRKSKLWEGEPDAGCTLTVLEKWYISWLFKLNNSITLRWCRAICMCVFLFVLVCLCFSAFKCLYLWLMQYAAHMWQSRRASQKSVLFYNQGAACCPYVCLCFCVWVGVVCVCVSCVSVFRVVWWLHVMWPMKPSTCGNNISWASPPLTGNFTLLMLPL